MGAFVVLFAVVAWLGLSPSTVECTDWSDWALKQSLREPVIQVNKRMFDEWVQDKNRKSKIVLLFTVRPQDIHQCHHCKQAQPAFLKTAHNYWMQAKNITTPDERVYFAQIFHTEQTGEIFQRMALRTMPALLAFKKGKSRVKFEEDPSRAKENREREEALSPRAVEKKAAAKSKKESKGGKKKGASSDEAWLQRLARREKQRNALATGVIEPPDDASYSDLNIVRFVRRNLGVTIALKEDPPKHLNPQKVLLAIALVIGGFMAVVVRLVVFPNPDPNLSARVEQLWLRGLRWAKEDLIASRQLPALQMRPEVRIFPSVFWSILFIFSVMAFLILAGGFYFNVLNPSPWSGQGRGGQPEYIQRGRGQYGVECYMVASGGLVFTATFIVLLILPRLPNATLRYALVLPALVAFMFALGIVWSMFLKKNQYFLNGTPPREWITRLADPVGKWLQI